MASGKIHNFINLSCWSLFLAAYLFDLIKIDSSFFIYFSCTFFVGTFLLSPDLDLANHPIKKVNSKKNWGLFGFLWQPYGRIFSHRGWSHTWIIGPITRIIYLFFVLSVISLPFFPIFINKINILNMQINIDKTAFSYAILGYFLSQWLHLIADRIPINYALILISKKRKSYKGYKNK